MKETDRTDIQSWLIGIFQERYGWHTPCSARRPKDWRSTQTEGNPGSPVTSSTESVRNW